ncbi:MULTISPECIES: MspA family porin [unclassified Mycobacterium]|uniref:MspA family porin n=1 Tax=unclassified Mycobacterium TaxID=2642494 RepID=UPI00073FC2AE|nr:MULTISPECIES: MspA family porin [unclassified Mycobacterium]KUH86101.1 MspA protein [Mycobacterium sp. IS-1556]KUH86975.1 MspA protein [Mycobacterium sp. GA-0227b]KUH92252.1 MspA protein [Mycobacterium sp. GA-1999]
MVNRFAVLTAACTLIAVGTTPYASAQPAPPPDPRVQPVANPVPPPPPGGAVPSGPTGTLDTPDGWHVEVSARDETQLPVAPLTTAVSSREYLVGGTFVGKVTGSGATELKGGTLVAGYQIGCGILADEIGIEPEGAIGVALPVPAIDAEIGLGGAIDLLPGEVTVVDVAEKEFEGTETRVTITGLRVKFDRCAGQSFIRSFATLSVSTEDTEDVITYLGVTKVV